MRSPADLPMQSLWTFDGVCARADLRAHYGTPILVRNYNNLPSDNGGFGLNSVSTHLHNGHTPSESDGFPCDYFARPASTTISTIPNQLAGFLSIAPVDQRRHQRGAEHALVPRPPRGLHLAERLQGPGGALHPVQPDTTPATRPPASGCRRSRTTTSR